MIQEKLNNLTKIQNHDTGHQEHVFRAFLNNHMRFSDTNGDHPCQMIWFLCTLDLLYVITYLSEQTHTSPEKNMSHDEGVVMAKIRNGDRILCWFS